MLCLSRKIGETLHIGAATVTIKEVRKRNGKPEVRLAIVAPRDVLILRDELVQQHRSDVDAKS